MGRNGFSLMVLGLLVVIVFTGGCSAPGEPDVERIQADLIGQPIANPSEGSDGVTFESLSQFQKITINNKNGQRNLIEYDVSISGDRCNVRIVVVYRKEGDNWKLISVTTKTLRCP